MNRIVPDREGTHGRAQDGTVLVRLLPPILFVDRAYTLGKGSDKTDAMIYSLRYTVRSTGGRSGVRVMREEQTIRSSMIAVIDGTLDAATRCVVYSHQVRRADAKRSSPAKRNYRLV